VLVVRNPGRALSARLEQRPVTRSGRVRRSPDTTRRPASASEAVRVRDDQNRPLGMV